MYLVDYKMSFLKSIPSVWCVFFLKTLLKEFNTAKEQKASQLPVNMYNIINNIVLYQNMNAI